MNKAKELEFGAIFFSKTRLMGRQVGVDVIIQPVVDDLLLHFGSHT